MPNVLYYLKLLMFFITYGFEKNLKIFYLSEHIDFVTLSYF